MQSSKNKVKRLGCFLVLQKNTRPARPFHQESPRRIEVCTIITYSQILGFRILLDGSREINRAAHVPTRTVFKVYYVRFQALVCLWSQFFIYLFNFQLHLYFMFFKNNYNLAHFQPKKISEKLNKVMWTYIYILLLLNFVKITFEEPIGWFVVSCFVLLLDLVLWRKFFDL